MLLIDLTHTSHTRARTGIQRVARALHHNVAGQAVPITRDPFLGAWRPLEPWEIANLANSQGGEKRKAQWPATARWLGRLRRVMGRTPAHAIHGEFTGLIVPELFVPSVARDLPKLFSHVRGPRVALFHDAIPLRFPELSPPGTVARFPSYLQELLMFDGIAANSEDSRDALVHYWHWLGIKNAPPVKALLLGVDPVETIETIAPSRGANPIVLAVGTLEGRKNHLALLEACERLWSDGAKFRLHIIGHVNAETGGAALARLRRLQQAGRDLRYDGPATDHAVSQAYADCAFTVYPSLAEGFGLPVIESLAHGKPCICSAEGALGEISQHGGCLGLQALDTPSIIAALSSLLGSPDKLATLASAARARTFKNWPEYTAELTTWMQSLPRR
jgi:glycosyltransferase involved in cell wall biosynthesis